MELMGCILMENAAQSGAVRNDTSSAPASGRIGREGHSLSATLEQEDPKLQWSIRIEIVVGV